jgi:hypothetical protein
LKLPRRRFLQLAAGAAALPAASRIARAQTATALSFSFSLGHPNPGFPNFAFSSAPAVCSWGPGRLDVFGRAGADGALWHKWLIGRDWSDWESLGGTLTAPPAAVSWGAGRIDVFVRGGDLALWHKWFTGGGWSNWESLGGVLNFGPAVSSWGPGRLDVFVRGGDNTIYQRTFDQGWRDWTSIAEPQTTGARPGIAAVSSATGKIDLFCWSRPEGAFTYLEHKPYRNGWKPSRTIRTEPVAEAAMNTSLAVASWMPDRLDWFMRASERTLEHTAGASVTLDAGLSISPPTLLSLNNDLTSGPAAVARPAAGNWIDVITRGHDNGFWHTVILPAPGYIYRPP